MSFRYSNIPGGCIVGTGSTTNDHNAVEDPNTLVGPITIPYSHNGKKVLKIGYKAFSYCHYITHVYIKAEIVSLERHAFLYCYNLMSINLPSTLERIEDAAIGIGNYVQGTRISNNLTVYIEGNSKLSYIVYHGICCKPYITIYYCCDHNVEGQADSVAPEKDGIVVVYSHKVVSFGSVNASVVKDFHCENYEKVKPITCMKKLHLFGQSLFFVPLFFLS